jgi:transposase
MGINCACSTPGKPISLRKPRGLRAKTDHLDAITIARVLPSGEARRGYVPTEVIATYRELVRLHTHLSDEVARYKNEIQALLIVLFPEFSQVFADPCRATAPLSAQTLSECTSVSLGRSRGDCRQAP